MTENNISALEIIQGIINRMGSNSFALKGWAVTLVAGILALASNDTDKRFFLVVYIPIIIFWFLDSYYLQLERKYIELYNNVRALKNNEFDFDMDISNIHSKDKQTEYKNCLISRTELLFYIPLAVLSSGIIIITNM